MTKKRAVFVDDEAQVLRSLKRGLRQHCGDWDFQFETLPAQALESILNDNPMVVISDRKMHEMDGEALLSEVKHSAPHVVRVLLTGDTSEKAVIASARTAHILLAKPFEISELSDVLDRAGALNQLPLNDQQRSALGQIQNLPVLPKIFHDLTTYLKVNANPDISEVVKLIKSDLGITAKLIQVANSSFFGYQSVTHSIEQVVMRLGFDLVRQLIALMVLNQGESFQKVLEQSEKITDIMKQRASELGQSKESIERLSLLGLLHGIGRLVPTIEESDKQSDIVGAYLLTLCGFDRDIIDAVMFQSQPEQQTPISPLTCQLHVAKLLSSDVNLNEISVQVVECAQLCLGRE